MTQSVTPTLIASPAAVHMIAAPPFCTSPTRSGPSRSFRGCSLHPYLRDKSCLAPGGAKGRRLPYSLAACPVYRLVHPEVAFS